MAKEKATPESPMIDTDAKTPKSAKSKAVEVAAPSISSEVDATIAPSRMEGSYLTVDARMDGSDITVMFSVKEAPELVLEHLVDSSGESGTRTIAIPLAYLTKTMGFTLLISYAGRAQGQPAVSLVKEVGVSFYPASESEALAPRLLHEKVVHSTPTYDMHDHTGDEIVKVPVPPLAKAGDKLYCTAATEQDAARHLFYTVVYGYELSAAEAVPGNVLSFSIRRGWLARRKPWRSLTLQCAWITSGLAAQPPADVDPHLETQLPGNALEIQRRRTAALIVDPALELKAPHLRQSVEYNGGWCLNPELTKEGGDVDSPDLDTYTGDRVCFFVSGPGYVRKPLGCVTIGNHGGRASVKLPSCIVACFFNKSMTLTYSVAFNENEQSSTPQLVSVLMPRFSHPGLEEATNGTVDLNTFPRDATAVMPVWAYAECSSCCWMWMTGERQDGSAYRYDILTGDPVTDDWKTQGVRTSIPRDALEALADCSDFELHFAASFCDSFELLDAHGFPAQAFNIVQKPLVLKAPKVTEAVGNDLTVWNGRDGVTVRVEYEGINATHGVSVCWTQTNGSCLPLLSKPGNSETGYVDFHIPREAVIRGAGKTVTVNYTVNSACKQGTSNDLKLQISVPVLLPTPVVPQATPPATQGGILDLRTFFGNAEITVEKWWFILPGQRVWLRGEGTRHCGETFSLDVHLGETVTDKEIDGGLNSGLKRVELDLLKSASTLIFTCKVTVDGSVNENEAVVFPLLSVTVRAVPAAKEDFDDLPQRFMTQGNNICIPSMTITHVSGPGYSGIHGWHQPPWTTGNSIVMCYQGDVSRPNQRLRLDFTSPCKRVKFAVAGLHYAGSVYSYNSAGDMLKEVYLPGLEGGEYSSWVEFVSVPGTPITRVDLALSDWVYIDNFEFFY